MEILLMAVLLILVVGALCVACFYFGAKVGQTVARGEDVKQALPNPVEAIREHREQKEAEREQNRVEVLMRNIENYDGTGMGQEDVPRG